MFSSLTGLCLGHVVMRICLTVLTLKDMQMPSLCYFPSFVQGLGALMHGL